MLPLRVNTTSDVRSVLTICRGEAIRSSRKEEGSAVGKKAAQVHAAKGQQRGAQQLLRQALHRRHCLLLSHSSLGHSRPTTGRHETPTRSLKCTEAPAPAHRD